jgi:hypothetical protein
MMNKELITLICPYLPQRDQLSLSRLSKTHWLNDLSTRSKMSLNGPKDTIFIDLLIAEYASPNVVSVTLREMEGDELAQLMHTLYFRLEDEGAFRCPDHPLSRIQSVTFDVCMWNMCTAKMFVKFFSLLFPDVVELRFVVCDWEFPHPFKQTLRSRSAPADWYEGMDGVTVPAYGRMHSELFRIGTSIVRGIFDSIRLNDRLKFLRFDTVDLGCMYRPFDDPSHGTPTMFSQLMSVSDSLSLMNFEKCNLEDDFLKFSKSIYQLETLRAILLPDNHLTDLGLTYLLTRDSALTTTATHPTLQLIDLRSNFIRLASSQVQTVLEDFLRMNPQCVIELSGNPLSIVPNHPRIFVNEDTERVGEAGTSDSEYESSTGSSGDSMATDSNSLVSEGSDLFKLLDD